MYDVLVSLRSRLKFYISRLRCDACYAPYSKHCSIYLCESGSTFEQNKSKFSIDSKPSGQPISFGARFPITWNSATSRHLYTNALQAARLVANPEKERVTRNVLSLEVCCSRCNNFKELEIDLDDFLPKQYGKASVTRDLSYPDEEE